LTILLNVVGRTSLRHWVLFSVWRPAIPAEIFSGVPQALQADLEVVP
jgi:hypothetical protein